jgi:hypothetical protein
MDSLAGWCMRVMDKSPTPARWQFSLRAMLLAVGLFAVFVAGIRYPSVASFVFALLVSLLVTAYTVCLAIRGTVRRRIFWSAYALVAATGIGLTLTAHTPIGGTPIVQVMWWDLTKWSGGGFSFNAACYQGTFYLALTLLAALAVAGLVLLIVKARRAS